MKGFIVRTKANSIKVLCAECVKRTEFEEYLRPWSTMISSRCLKCQRRVFVSAEDSPPRSGKKLRSLQGLETRAEMTERAGSSHEP